MVSNYTPIGAGDRVQAVHGGGIEWTIKDGIPYHVPTLMREVRDMVVAGARSAPRRRRSAVDGDRKAAASFQPRQTRQIDISIVIAAPPAGCCARSSTPTRSAPGGRRPRSITTPRVLGPYVIEWRPTEFRDEVLGRLGGVLRGTVMQIDAATASSSLTCTGCRPTAIRSDRWRSR